MSTYKKIVGLFYSIERQEKKLRGLKRPQNKICSEQDILEVSKYRKLSVEYRTNILRDVKELYNILRILYPGDDRCISVYDGDIELGVKWIDWPVGISNVQIFIGNKLISNNAIRV